MKVHFTRFFSVLLSLIILCAAISCGETSVPEDTSSAARTEGTQTIAETKPVNPLSVLEKTDYEEEDYSVLFMQELEKYYFVESDTGDIMSAAVLKRNMAVEDYFNIKLVPIAQSGMAAGASAFKTLITASCGAGDGAYDLAAPNYWYGITLSIEGCYENLLDDLPLDFSNPWWASGYNTNLQVGGKLYACTGDYDIQQYSSLLVLFFNKYIADDYNLEYPYQLVDEGKWTVEKMLQYAQTVKGDSIGTQAGSEPYGIILNKWSIRGFVTAFGMEAVTHKDDAIELTLFNEKSVDAYGIINKLVNESEYCYKSSAYTENDYMAEMFSDNKALMLGIHLGAAESLRDMEMDYGIVPLPKYSEDQENYITGSVGCTIYAILTSASDKEMSAAVLEGLNLRSYSDVSPTYYELVLKYRDSRDLDSIRMIDLIHNTLYYDFGYVWDTSLSDIYVSWGDSIINKSGELSSWYPVQEPMYKSALRRLKKAFE